MIQDIFYTMDHSKRVLAWVYLKESLAIEAMIRHLKKHRFGAKRYEHLKDLAQLHLRISLELDEEYTVDMIRLELQSLELTKKNEVLKKMIDKKEISANKETHAKITQKVHAEKAIFADIDGDLTEIRTKTDKKIIEGVK